MRIAVLVLALVGCTKEPEGPTDADGDGIAAEEDCDDGDAAIGGVVPMFSDVDQDGHGGTFSEDRCPGEEGWTQLSDDCNDADATRYPGAAERCNGMDDDCDGTNDN